MNLFLGKPLPYWLELKKRADELDASDLLAEVVELRGKLSFYESRIREMATAIKL